MLRNSNLHGLNVKPQNKEVVVIYSVVDEDEAALTPELATYLVAGTEVTCGIDHSQLKELSPVEALLCAIAGAGEVRQEIIQTGFYSVSYHDDVAHYNYLTAADIKAWMSLPVVTSNEVSHLISTEQDIQQLLGICSPTAIQEYYSKSLFVGKIAAAFKEQSTAIDDIKYEVYYNTRYQWVHECIVVTYDGGAIAVRNNTGNSITATYGAIQELVNGGYYREVKFYREMQDNPDCVKLNIVNPNIDVE